VPARCFEGLSRSTGLYHAAIASQTELEAVKNVLPAGGALADGGE
jgi:hypothetical protein